MTAKKRKAIPPEANQPNKVIEFPQEAVMPRVTVHHIAIPQEDLEQRYMQLFKLLENAARRVQLEEQHKGG